MIKISKEDLLEYLYESFSDSQESFFDVSDATSIVKCFDFDYETDSFIFVARKAFDDEEEKLQFDGIDTAKLLSNMKDTTDSLYNG